MTRHDENNNIQCYVLTTDGQPRKVSCTPFFKILHPESLIIQEAQNGLLPSHTYGVLPRGDLTHITSLTHQQLQEAHAKHLCPSYASFLGFPPTATCFLESHMEFIDSSQVEFSQIEPSMGEPLEQCWKKPQSKHELRVAPLIYRQET
ncbi:hypothetical protein RRG08_047644 [Elysia crispata]|uniref:Uncharacterized protein n=1 Tax=Elysia crispata TaxID=231223 RepID=A0AAE0ZQS6_9GAST|nr:hypothetical protein RRG08_047644 [Elysia crispata]